MKYIQKGQDNTFTLKLNSTYEKYSGSTSGWTQNVFYFEFYHIQSQINSGMSLTDISDKRMVTSKFTLSSGITLNMSSGQYQVNVYEDSTKSVLITTEYFVFKDIATNTDVIYNPTSDDIIIYK
jgi:hypothetical protein